MKRRQKNQKIEQDVEGNSLIIKNKNDDIEGTFSYKLFEEQYFDTNKIEELINYISYNKLSIKEKEILRWMINCVDNCFIYHKDINDYYIIKNYSKKIEKNWAINWKLKLMDVLNE